MVYLLVYFFGVTGSQFLLLWNCHVVSVILCLFNVNFVFVFSIDSDNKNLREGTFIV